MVWWNRNLQLMTSLAHTLSEELDQLDIQAYSFSGFIGVVCEFVFWLVAVKISHHNISIKG